MSDTLAERAFPDGRIVQVIPLTFGRARLCIMPTGSKECIWK